MLYSTLTEDREECSSPLTLCHSDSERDASPEILWYRRSTDSDTSEPTKRKFMVEETSDGQSPQLYNRQSIDEQYIDLPEHKKQKAAHQGKQSLPIRTAAGPARTTLDGAASDAAHTANLGGDPYSMFVDSSSTMTQQQPQRTIEDNQSVLNSADGIGSLLDMLSNSSESTGAVNKGLYISLLEDKLRQLRSGPIEAKTTSQKTRQLLIARIVNLLYENLQLKDQVTNLRGAGNRRYGYAGFVDGQLFGYHNAVQQSNYPDLTHHTLPGQHNTLQQSNNYQVLPRHAVPEQHQVHDPVFGENMPLSFSSYIPSMMLTEPALLDPSFAAQMPHERTSHNTMSEVYHAPDGIAGGPPNFDFQQFPMSPSNETGFFGTTYDNPCPLDLSGEGCSSGCFHT